jgi:Fe-S-cluster containining protein
MENKTVNPIDDAQKLKLNDTFTFSCTKSLPCFNQCCADINIVLTPYDIIRLKNRLNITSDEFLNKYAVIPFNKQQKLPVVILKMNEDEGKPCPFVSKAGCSVYTDRPWACRMYPIGLAASDAGEEFYFIMKEEGCLGLNEKKEMTVLDWLADQGITEYNEIGRYFKEITMHPFFTSGKDLDPGPMEMLFLVCYNIDKFRRFVFESSFLNAFEVDKDMLAKIKDDDIELLKFGYNWLRFSIFKEKIMTIKEEIVEAKKKDLKTAGKNPGKNKGK